MMACASKKLWYAFVALTACYLFAVPCSYCSEVDQGRVSELLKQADKMKTEGYYSQAAALMEEVLAFKKQETDIGSTAELTTPLDNTSDRIEGKIDIENPLLRSGILLAGAKRSLTTRYSGYHDGIVTAEKILGMNLQGTKMVVLSACDTGLGEVKKMNRCQALRQATIDQIEIVRQRYGHSNPRYWGAFVFMGEP